MTTHPSLRAQWRHSGVVFLRMWVTGWKVLIKAVVATVILSGAAMLGGFAYQFVHLIPEDAAWGLTLHLLCSLLGLPILLPLAFYVAASWVGFCPYVDHDEHDPSH